MSNNGGLSVADTADEIESYVDGKSVGQARADQNLRDRWTIRGITPEAIKRAKVLAQAAGQPIGVWLTNLIANASDNLSDTTGSDIVSIVAALAARVENLECAVFPSDKSDAVNGGMQGESTQASSLKSATATVMEAGRDRDGGRRAFALMNEAMRQLQKHAVAGTDGD